ncbi:2,3-bisphosphoglycerate-dependent phosphoglycerate mutase [Gloeocapsopsis crepidinum LEGE 06123]|uniref:2,3-bisphosphoglycerate-dependent phosphoglycerate mutase n=1 Tax=Gloeocapsopsis crepidinum LEGE 06123 TaxID=588587 RepID=A0ABR9UNA8_9CHRO|nr:2,3-bisphosphoglycerate-dependent phosphoglycerate mutase [Gloeocapsopsis crepidinum]MBE9189759.1 2,3-bisphosphoglycerate-dependent phosphoglycerate mutase [Gloeocapsopsis crepidinum LEGE 06123]
MATLILVRHGQSTWNAANRFSGWVDVPLNHVGRQEAMQAAKKISSYRIDVCFTSLLVRAIETTAICLTEGTGACLDKSPVFKHDSDDPDWHGWDKYEGYIEQEIPIFMNPALDERHYGDLQGFNKADMAEKVGKNIVHQWRRSFDTRPPGGESLKDTAARTIPFFQNRILVHLKNGDNVLVSAHGNSLRSILMHLDNLSPKEVPHLELATGIPIVYEIDAEANITNKVILD